MSTIIARGTVTRIADGGVFAVVPKLGTDEKGPLAYLTLRVTIEGVPSWTNPPQPGDTVIVATVDGSLDQLIVLGGQS